MRVFAAKDEKELLRKKYCGSDDGETESGDGAHDRRVAPAECRCLLGARERRRENVREEITQDRKDHGEPAECSHFRNRADLLSKNANEENRDLALKTEEDCIRGLASNETDHRGAIFCILGRVEIDDAGNITTQHPVLEQQRRGADGDRHGAIQKEIH